MTFLFLNLYFPYSASVLNPLLAVLFTVGACTGGKPCQDIFKSIHGLNGFSLFTLYSGALTHPPLEKEKSLPFLAAILSLACVLLSTNICWQFKDFFYFLIYIVPCYFSLFPLIQMLLIYKISPNHSYFVTLLPIFASTSVLNVGHRCVTLLPLWGLGRSRIYISTTATLILEFNFLKPKHLQSTCYLLTGIKERAQLRLSLYM